MKTYNVSEDDLTCIVSFVIASTVYEMVLKESSNEETTVERAEKMIKEIVDSSLRLLEKRFSKEKHENS